MSRDIKEWEDSIDFSLPMRQPLGLEIRPPASKGFCAPWASCPQGWSPLSPNNQHRVPSPIGEMGLWSPRCQPAEARPLAPVCPSYTGKGIFVPLLSQPSVTISVPNALGSINSLQGKKVHKRNELCIWNSFPWWIGNLNKLHGCLILRQRGRRGMRAKEYSGGDQKEFGAREVGEKPWQKDLGWKH